MVERKAEGAAARGWEWGLLGLVSRRLAVCPTLGALCVAPTSLIPGALQESAAWLCFQWASLPSAWLLAHCPLPFVPSEAPISLLVSLLLSPL